MEWKNSGSHHPNSMKGNEEWNVRKWQVENKDAWVLLHSISS